MGNQKETQKNPQYKYASTREKLCFGIGAIGKDAICNLVGAFLMLYFTDTLYLAPAFVGVLFFVARIWDAINDPMMGRNFAFNNRILRFAGCTLGKTEDSIF